MYARWVGEQNGETVQLGCLACLEMIIEQGAGKLLNDSSQVTGPWYEINEWVATYLTPRALSAGLQYFAFVVPPGLEGKLSVVDLHQRIGGLVHMRIFLEAEEAESWLASLDEAS